MKRITPQIEDEHVEYIEEIQMEAESDISDAEAVRRIFDRAMQHEAEMERREAEVERLESEVEQTEARIDELRSKLVATSQKVEASNELVRVVEEEQSLEKRRAEAGALTRAKWWLTGMPSEKR
jgi:predicted RNase H-like nuclease (RuvC/YqgF family)